MPSTPSEFQRQRGVALFAVIVFVMLSLLLTLWASRTSLLNEMVVGNDADYQRAFEAAQALLQDAELDIRGENADGSACTGSNDICRRSTADKIPLEAQDVGPLLAVLEQQGTGCRNGLCTKRAGKQDFWNNADAAHGPTLAQMASPGVGARYGQFTGAATGSADKPAHPILADTSSGDRGGWYWIEVLPYDTSSKSSSLIAGTPGNLLPLHLAPSVVYRITALAYGLRPSTMVVLQQTYARQKRKD
jgi:type IV pilus assembly protein PilX